MSKEVEAIEDGGEGLARGGEFVTQRADTHAGGIRHLALVAVFAVGQEQDGLLLLSEMRQRALEIDFAGRGHISGLASAS